MDALAVIPLGESEGTEKRMGRLMPERDIEEQELRIELMSTQIEKFRQEMRYQPWIALATFMAAVAAVSGVILGLAHFLR